VNFALTDEQEFLQEAARGTLSRVGTVEAARSALEGEALPDLWPAACDAGWPGLLVSEDDGGAGLGVMDAMLVFAELGRVLAAVPLLGHLPATHLLDRGGADAGLLAALATGAKRAAYVPTRPPTDVDDAWTVEPLRGSVRERAGAGAGWVPDAPGADVLVAVDRDGTVLLVDDFEVEPVTRYDATRSLGHVRFGGGTELAGDAASAWYLAQALLGAEALGAVERALEVSVQYAKERFTFGRAIGSYQAVKHQLVEVLRRMDNARSLMYYAGWAGADMPAEFPLAASAFRLSAGKALDDAARTQISVHGGIGATWEHDAPLYFRRAQLSRRLLGGTAGAADRVAGELFEQARAAEVVGR
jgi:alkylation response protein AidB-like acyl-CoA dehydrogenase